MFHVEHLAVQKFDQMNLQLRERFKEFGLKTQLTRLGICRVADIRRNSLFANEKVPPQ
jgi:hypothetical protein